MNARQLADLEGAGVGVVAIGLGDLEAASTFCQLTHFPEARVFASLDARPYDALGFAPGFARAAPPTMTTPR